MWHSAAQTSSIALLEILWSLAKEEDLNLYELKNNLLLAQDKHGEIAWQVAAHREHIEVLEKQWVWAKEQELNLSELKNKLLKALDKFEKMVC